MCKLSVIIPVYNTFNVLARCVDSVLGQGFADFELVLIDDGSTDGSEALCDAYALKDKRVSVFHKTRGGPSSARNVGLDNATGQWITFIDSDDFIEDGYFDLPYDNGCDLYVRNWCYANGCVVEHFEPQTINEAYVWEFAKKVIHSFAFRTGHAFFYQKRWLETFGIRFDERFHLGEDGLFVLDYLMHCANLQILDGPSYRYDRSDHWERKYVLSWQEAESYLTVFIAKYDSLPIAAPELSFQIFGLFRKLIAKDERHMHRKWLSSEPVKRFIETQLPVRGRLFRWRYAAKELFWN